MKSSNISLVIFQIPFAIIILISVSSVSLTNSIFGFSLYFYNFYLNLIYPNSYLIAPKYW